MARVTVCLLFSILLTQCFAQNLSDFSQDIQFVCGKSKSIKNCRCSQDTDDILNIPLFNIDCSRLGFTESPPQNVLPILMGSLDLSHNSIEQLKETTELDIETLHFLDYSYNKIKYISNGYFKNASNLISLNLEHNYLTEVHEGLVIGLKSLKKLNLASNDLTSITKQVFDNLPALEELILSNNDLGDFFFQMDHQILPPHLINLRIDNIHLHNITRNTFKGLDNIKSLTIIDNPIQEMFVLPFGNLESLDISGINITKIEAKHLNFTSLKELKMNRLKRLSTVGDSAFYFCKNLEDLEIENCNELKQLPSMSFGMLSYETMNTSNLKRLSLAKNNLENLDISFEFLFKGLEELNLQENPWSCLCSISWFAKLKNVIDVNDTRCNSPPQLQFKIVTELQPNQFVCLENRNTHEGVSTRTWLFPLIGVLSLIVLILVGILFYMGPFQSYNSSWTRSIGPESPYNRMTIEVDMDESSRRL